jgi:hypothetical protein
LNFKPQKDITIMKTKLKSLLLAAAASTVLAGVTHADPLVNVKILVSTSQNGTYTDTLTVTPGEQLFFQVQGSMAALNTVNGTKTITSLTQGTDGIINLPFTLTDTATGNVPLTFNTSVLDTNATGTGSSAGTAGANTLTGAKVVANTPNGAPPYGVASSNTPAFQTLLTGTFTVGNTITGTSTIGEVFPTGSSGSFKINNGSTTLYSNATQDASFISYAPLTLNSAATPEPTCIALVGAGCADLLARRRSQKATRSV